MQLLSYFFVLVGSCGLVYSLLQYGGHLGYYEPPLAVFEGYQASFGWTQEYEIAATVSTGLLVIGLLMLDYLRKRNGRSS